MQMSSPFIHLLESPNAKYFFDVNANEIVPVSDELYDVIKKFLSKKNLTLSNEEEQKIEELKSMGYLSEHRVMTIKHPVSEFLETYLNRKMEKITLQVTQNCNLRCAYCVYTDTTNEKQRQHSSKSMSFELAKKGIDFLLEHSIDSEIINIAFYGGEPLLKFDLIKKIIIYAEETIMDKELSFSLTTNATLITKEMMDFFSCHEISMSISLDGPQAVHDSNRRFAINNSGSFNKVMETLEWINKEYPEYVEKTLISMVIDPKYSYDYINSIFSDYPFLKKILIMPSIIDDMDSKVKVIFSDEYIEEQEYRMFLGLLNYFNRVDDIYISPLIEKEILQIDSKAEKFDPTIRLPDQTAPSGPCIPGKMRLFMDVNGNFLPCEKVNELSEIMRIGNIEEGFFLDKIDALLNIGTVTAEMCRNCWAFTNCTLCAKFADGSHEISGELKSTFCDGVRNDLENHLYCMILLREFKEVYHQSFSEVSI